MDEEKNARPDNEGGKRLETTLQELMDAARYHIFTAFSVLGMAQDIVKDKSETEQQEPKSETEQQEAEEDRGEILSVKLVAQELNLSEKQALRIMHGLPYEIIGGGEERKYIGVYRKDVEKVKAKRASRAF